MALVCVYTCVVRVPNMQRDNLYETYIIVGLVHVKEISEFIEIDINILIAENMSYAYPAIAYFKPVFVE